MSDEDRLGSDALEWAKTHLLRFGDSDILAKPLEYEAIASHWSKIKQYLEDVDLSCYETRPLERFLVPKPDAGFRIATRLDPLDALVYTAAVYEVSEAIEKHRFPKHARVACSYRLRPTADGSLFGKDNGWGDFYKRSLDLSRQKRLGWVVLADIADFYSQINHHRIENALAAAGVDEKRSKSIEGLLRGWSAKQSRGLPVGPMASIPLAESCLSDVDQYLSREGWKHTRYVDDFRIFCRSRTEAYRALHGLTDYLFTAHRLSLASSKTSVTTTDMFRSDWLENPEFLERQAQSKRVLDLLSSLLETTGYSFEEGEIEGDDIDEIARDTIDELFELCLESRPLRLGMVRYLLRRAGALRTNKVQSRVVANLEQLLPVLRDTINYLERVRQPKSASTVVRALSQLARGSDFRFLPFVHDWALHALSGRFATESGLELSKLGRSSSDVLGTRAQARVAMVRGHIDWVRQHKETWRGLGPWDRRATIAAGSVLSADERKHWRQTIMSSSDPLDVAMAVHFLRPR